MPTYIKNKHPLKIERREWYNFLQFDISTLFRPNPTDSTMALRLTQLDNTPEAIQFFASHCQGLTDYGYWFFLGVCWVQYTGWSELELWKRLFCSSRPHRNACLMKPTEHRLFKSLPANVHCYRVHRPGEKDWISYTLDQDTAKRFAAIRGVREIHEYTIPRKRLLCLFLRRHEYEVLCLDPLCAKLYGTLAI